MNQENLQPIANLVEELQEFAQEVSEARSDDGKIKRLEWIGVFKEGSDVLKAIRDLRDVDLVNATDSDLYNIANIVMDGINREVKFNREHVFHALNIVRSSLIMPKL